jgi:hypothetical protein
MHLRSLIQGGRAGSLSAPATPRIEPPTLATVATVATVDPFSTRAAEIVETVATVAALGKPESWADHLRSLAPVEGVSWDVAAAVLDSLMAAGAIDKALGLGWDVRELIGVCRSRPHDSPSLAGLIFSMRAGDTVPDVRRSGCIIAYGNVRHIWKRTPIAAAVCLPWDLPGSAAATDVWET